MEVLIYILIFLSTGLVIVAIFETIGEVLRVRIANKNLNSLHSLLKSTKNIEFLQYQKIADAIVISDIKDSYELEETLKSIKKIELSNRPEQRNESV